MPGYSTKVCKICQASKRRDGWLSSRTLIVLARSGGTCSGFCIGLVGRVQGQQHNRGTEAGLSLFLIREMKSRRATYLQEFCLRCGRSVERFQKARGSLPRGRRPFLLESLIQDFSKTNSERATNSKPRRMDLQRAAGQRDAKVQYKTRRAPLAPQAP